MLTVLLRTAPVFQKVTPMSCLKGFPAWHRDHCSTHSIDAVSQCSYGHSSCFSWGNVLHSNQHVCRRFPSLQFPRLAPPLSWFPSLLVHATAKQQQADSRQAPEASSRQAAAQNQVPGRSRRRNDVKTTYKRGMKRRWNQTLATPGPEWAAPIPAAPTKLSSRKRNPWKN